MIKAYTFNDFQNLILQGKQRILSLSEYSLKPNNTKHNRQLIIKYFFKDLTLKSKL